MAWLDNTTAVAAKSARPNLKTVFIETPPVILPIARARRRLLSCNGARPQRKCSLWVCQPSFLLHHRAHVPGHEFALAVAMPLALALGARGRIEHQAEELLADLVDARVAVGDLAAVQVDVLLLFRPQRGVGRQLERRRRRATIGR